MSLRINYLRCDLCENIFILIVERLLLGGEFTFPSAHWRSHPAPLLVSSLGPGHPLSAWPPVLPRHFSVLCLGSFLFVFILLRVSWPNLFLWELPCFWYFLSLVCLCTAFWVIASVLLPSLAIFSLTVSNMLLKPVHWAFSISHYSYYFWRVSLLPCPAKSNWSFLVYLFTNCLYLL